MHRRVECPLKCGTSIRHKQLREHMDAECPRRHSQQTSTYTESPTRNSTSPKRPGSVGTDTGAGAGAGVSVSGTIGKKITKKE